MISIHLSAITWKIALALVINVANAVIITLFGGWSLPSLTEQGIVGLLTAALVTWNTWQSKRRDRVVNDIHTLTNSAMGAQLKLNVEFAQANAVLAHRLSAMSKEEGDIAAATAADVVVETQKSIYQEHLVRQAKVDAQQEKKI